MSSTEVRPGGDRHDDRLAGSPGAGGAVARRPGLAFGQLRPESVPIGVGRRARRHAAARARWHEAASPSGTQVGVRSEPILLDRQPSAVMGARGGPAMTRDPELGSAARFGGSPAGPFAGLALEAPEVDLVVPEEPGSIVSLQRAILRREGHRASGVTFPVAPGVYRLVVTLHDRTGLAYDAGDPGDAAPRYRSRWRSVHGGVRRATGADHGRRGARHVRGAGRERRVRRCRDAVSATPPVESDALLTWLRTLAGPAAPGRDWVSTAGVSVPVPVSRALEPIGRADRAGRPPWPFDLDAPPIPGEYLLLLDVLTPAHGALSKLGQRAGARCACSVTADARPPGSPAPATTAPSPAASPAPRMRGGASVRARRGSCPRPPGRWRRSRTTRRATGGTPRPGRPRPARRSGQRGSRRLGPRARPPRA